jgi:hypothetical protein
MNNKNIINKIHNHIIKLNGYEFNNIYLKKNKNKNNKIKSENNNSKSENNNSKSENNNSKSENNNSKSENNNSKSENNISLIDYFKSPIGLFDPYGDNINPLTRKPYENLYKDEYIEYKSGPLIGITVPKTYKNLAYNWTQLTVYKNVPEILKSIKKNQVTIIKAGTGVGKTVIVPKVALQVFNFQKKVICTVPKQIIANTNAKYSAECLDVQLGKEIGYYYMGQNMTSSSTMLTFTTPGSLKSKLTGTDPFLTEYSCVIIDEIHERSVQTDQLLLMMKEIMIKDPNLD